MVRARAAATANAAIQSGTFAVALSRATSFALGPITLIAIGLFLSPTEQGLYYTFMSVLAAMVFFESGVGTVVVQLAARHSGIADGSAALPAVMRFATAWYRGVAIVGAPTVFTAGLFVFHREPPHVWFWPWALLCFVAALDLTAQPRMFVLEGTGGLVSVYRCRTARAIVQSAVIASLVAAGIGLMAVPAGWLLGHVCVRAFLWRQRHTIARRLAKNQQNRINWRRDVLPFQWRVAVSWAAGYFGLALITPAVMAAQGSEAAGRVGMSLAVLTTCTGVAASIMQACAPRLASLAAGHTPAAMPALFKRRALLSTVVAIAAITAALLAAIALEATGHPFAHRLLPPTAMAFLGLGIAAYHIEGVLAFFMRAQGKEPYFVLEATAALALLPTTTWLASERPLAEISLGFAGIHAGVVLPVAIAIYVRSARAYARACAPYSSPITTTHRDSKSPR